MYLESAPIAVFQENTIPGGTMLAGWAALVHALAIPAPVRRLSCVSEKHVSGSHRQDGPWTIFDRRYWPGHTFAAHLSFALRHEDIDLLILKRVFEAVPQDVVAAMVRAAPTGIPARRAWYLYETLTGLPSPSTTCPGLKPSIFSTRKRISPASRASQSGTEFATTYLATVGSARLSAAPKR